MSIGFQDQRTVQVSKDYNFGLVKTLYRVLMSYGVRSGSPVREGFFIFYRFLKKNLF